MNIVQRTSFESTAGAIRKPLAYVIDGEARVWIDGRAAMAAMGMPWGRWQHHMRSLAAGPLGDRLAIVWHRASEGEPANLFLLPANFAQWLVHLVNGTQEYDANIRASASALFWSWDASWLAAQRSAVRSSATGGSEPPMGFQTIPSSDSVLPQQEPPAPPCRARRQQ